MHMVSSIIPYIRTRGGCKFAGETLSSRPLKTDWFVLSNENRATRTRRKDTCFMVTRGKAAGMSSHNLFCPLNSPGSSAPPPPPNPYSLPPIISPAPKDQPTRFPPHDSQTPSGVSRIFSQPSLPSFPPELYAAHGGASVDVTMSLPSFPACLSAFL